MMTLRLVLAGLGIVFSVLWVMSEIDYRNVKNSLLNMYCTDNNAKAN